MNSDKPPRPPTKDKLADPAIRERFIDLLWKGATMVIAADSIDVSRQAIYQLMDRDEEFAIQVREARAGADDRVESALYRNAVSKNNVVAQIFWLKNRRPLEWRDKHDINLSGANGEPLTFRAFLADGTPLSAAPETIPTGSSSK